MSRHIAQGLGWPVFFYGQPYMGSLEPSVGALFCWLLGSSGLAVCLGTALIGFLILPVVYAWAQEIGGTWAGFAAMAFVIVGPANYYPYLCQPRGGYAVIILSSALALALVSRLTALERENMPQSWHWYLALGLAAGIGWWTSGLTIAAIVAAALLFIIFAWRQIRINNTLPCLIGFVVGSAPFWVWNARHGNAAAAYLLKGAAPVSPWMHIRLVIAERIPTLFGLANVPGWWRAIVLATIAAGILTAAGIGIAALLRNKNNAVIHLTGIMLFMLVWFVFYCRSSFADLQTPRYLTPLAPAFAVLAGVILFWRKSLFWRIPAAVGFAILICSQPTALLGAWKQEAKDKLAIVQAEREDDAIHTLCPNEDTFYMGFPYYWRNFNTARNFCFTPFAHERYQPFFERAEYRDTCATRGNFGGVREFLNVSGGSAGYIGHIICDFQPPLKDVEEIPPEEFISIISASSGDLGRIMCDADFDTFWRRPPQNENLQNDAIDVIFREPVNAAGLRLVSHTLAFPEKLQAQAWLPNADEPVVLIPQNATPHLFWSGPRLFWQGRFFRVECRWPPVAVTKLRIYLSESRSFTWKLSELQVFRHASRPNQVSEKEALPDLLKILQERGIESLYADRWVANAVHRETAGRIKTEREFGPDDLLKKGKIDTLKINRLIFKQHTGLLALTQDAPLCRRVLAARGVDMRETETGPWTLFDFTKDQWSADAEDVGLYWAGFGCLLTDDLGFAISLLLRSRNILKSGGSEQEAIRQLERAAACAPEFMPVFEELAELNTKAGNTETAMQWEARAAASWNPAVPALARFPGDIEFLGLSLGSTNLHPGQSFDIRYYWKCPSAGIQANGIEVFVHFKNSSGKLIFQNDHGLLRDFATDRQPMPLVFVEKHQIPVPPDIEAGEYSISLGLYLRGGRLKPYSALPIKDRAVHIPARLMVLDKGGVGVQPDD